MPPSDFDIIRNMGGPNTEATPMGAAETIAALNRMRETQAGMQAQQKDQAPPPLPQGIGGIRSNADGTYSFDKVDPRLFEGLMQSKQKLDEIMGAFHQEATRLQAQEQQVRAQPWMQLATALSANLAQARDMPGFVQALGRTAGQLNPTADQLRSQRLAVLGEESKMVERKMALEEAELRTVEVAADRKARLAETAAYHEALAAGRASDLQRKMLDDQLDLAKGGKLPPLKELQAAEERGLLPKGSASYLDAANTAAKASIEVQNKLRGALQTQRDVAAKERANIMARSRASQAEGVTANQAEKNYHEMIKSLDSMKRARDFKVATAQQNIFTQPEEKARLEEEIRGDNEQIKAAEEEVAFLKTRLDTMRKTPPAVKKPEPTTSEKAKGRLKALRGGQDLPPAVGGVRKFTDLTP